MQRWNAGQPMLRSEAAIWRLPVWLTGWTTSLYASPRAAGRVPRRRSGEAGVESLLPLLNPAAWLDTMRSKRRAAGASAGFGGAVISYVFDLPDARYIQEMYEQFLSAPDATAERVHEMALESAQAHYKRHRPTAWATAR